MIKFEYEEIIGEESKHEFIDIFESSDDDFVIMNESLSEDCSEDESITI